MPRYLCSSLCSRGWGQGQAFLDRGEAVGTKLSKMKEIPGLRISSDEWKRLNSILLMCWWCMDEGHFWRNGSARWDMSIVVGKMGLLFGICVVVVVLVSHRMLLVALSVVLL